RTRRPSRRGRQALRRRRAGISRSRLRPADRCATLRVARPASRAARPLGGLERRRGGTPFRGRAGGLVYGLRGGRVKMSREECAGLFAIFRPPISAAAASGKASPRLSAPAIRPPPRGLRNPPPRCPPGRDSRG